MERVLFICTHNSARSQMAEGLIRHDHGDRYEAYSAGTESTFVKPLAIAAMAEIGIDISGHRSETVDVYRDVPMDYVVTVCDSARETCPYFPAKKQIIHRDFDDPSNAEGTEEERLQAFRHTRDEIREWIAGTFGRTQSSEFRVQNP
jgi:arsenate reductase